ncbi:MAG: ABC transporter substrate-binding protein [Proteobacteria bacterium]|nr:ABC transporter substrate-binding protein [Burkholderiales bacterium]
MKLTLIENFRALFYAPFYATEALGAYRAEGLEVSMITPTSSDQTIQILAAGGAEVSWGGPMRLMIARDQDPAADSVAFCEVVGRDPFFLVGRKPNSGFRIHDLVGQRLATVSEVPTPWICLQRDLVLAGIDPASLTRAPQRTMGENVAALRAGDVDVIQVFHPFTHALVAEGAGHVWSRAAERGLACYTTLNTTRAFVQSNPDTLLRMTRALYRTQKWIAAHEGAELARVVGGYLPDLAPAVLAACFDEYKSSGVWSVNPMIQRGGLEWKRDAMLSCGATRTRLEYEAYVDPQFAQRVMRDDPTSM